MWLRSVSRKAQDFASSLYLTTANAGVMLGSFAGGSAIEHLGMPGAIRCGLAFCGLAALTIVLKAAIYGSNDGRLDAPRASDQDASYTSIAEKPCPSRG
jgi:predicted MFS family arabinose efflux permease